MLYKKLKKHTWTKLAPKGFQLSLEYDSNSELNLKLFSCISLYIAEDGASLSGLEHSFTRIASKAAAAACSDESWQLFNLSRIKNGISSHAQICGGTSEQPAW